MTPRSRSNNRKQEILQEAACLFASKGYDGTTIRNVGNACDITEAAIYRHFTGKADLYEKAVRYKAQQHDLRGELAEHAGLGTIEEALKSVAHHILSLADRDPDLVRFMFSSHLEDGHGNVTLFIEVRSPYIDFVRDEITARIKTGEVREVDPFLTGRCFVGMVIDCALSSGIWSDVTGIQFNADNVVCNNVPIFARGLCV
jgi:AcrR family transcriptional regulator